MNTVVEGLYTLFNRGYMLQGLYTLVYGGLGYDLNEMERNHLKKRNHDDGSHDSDEYFQVTSDSEIEEAQEVYLSHDCHMIIMYLCRPIATS